MEGRRYPQSIQVKKGPNGPFLFWAFFMVLWFILIRAQNLAKGKIMKLSEVKSIEEFEIPFIKGRIYHGDNPVLHIFTAHGKSHEIEDMRPNVLITKCNRAVSDRGYYTVASQDEMEKYRLCPRCGPHYEFVEAMEEYMAFREKRAEEVERKREEEREAKLSAIQERGDKLLAWLRAWTDLRGLEQYRGEGYKADTFSFPIQYHRVIVTIEELKEE